MAAAKETGSKSGAEKKSSKLDRYEVWNAHVGKKDRWAKCFFCRDRDMDLGEPTGWECAHVVSKRDGGNLKIENIFPACHPCNRSCGAMNMVEWAWGRSYVPHEKAVKAYLDSGGHLEGYEHKAEAKTPPPNFGPRIDTAGWESGRNGGLKVHSKLMNCEEVFKLLETTKVWDQQRPADNIRALLIAERQKKTRAQTGEYAFQGQPFTLVNLPHGSVLVDGQHRYIALHVLDHREAGDARVQVYECKDMNDVRAVFEQINMITPVPEEYYNVAARSALEPVFAAMQERFPGAETETNPHRPYYMRASVTGAMIRVEGFKEALLESRVTAGDVFAEIESVNGEAWDGVENTGVTNFKVEKGKRNGCYANAKETYFYAGLWHRKGIDYHWAELAASRALAAAAAKLDSVVRSNPAFPTEPPKQAPGPRKV